MCSACGIEKSSDDFYKDRSRKSGLGTYCKECMKLKYSNRDKPTIIRDSKRCPRCNKTKQIKDFYKNRGRADGHTTYCKECIAKYSHNRYINNKEMFKDRLNKWRRENREYVRMKDKKYRLENPDIEFNKQKRYREKNKKKLYIKGVKYRKENVAYFLNKNRERVNRLKNNSDGTVTLEAENQLYETQNHRCRYCSCDLDVSGRHLDHIIPISKGGQHIIANVQWTCPKCNLSKGNKLESEWLNER